MKKFLFTTAFSITLFSLGAYAQEKKLNINGKVISFEESFPLEGVNVIVKGTKATTGTQSDGTFTLEISPDDKILVISLKGYESQEVKLGKSRDYSIVLKRSGDQFITSKVDKDSPLLDIKRINLN